MITRENGVVQCNTPAEVAFAKSVIALTESMCVEWSRRVEDLKKMYAVSCQIHTNMNFSDWSEVVLRHD